MDVAAASGGTRLITSGALDAIDGALDVPIHGSYASCVGPANPIPTLIDHALGRPLAKSLEPPYGQTVDVLALDFDETLVSNALSMVPRPGLLQFLECALELFRRVVIFTTVNEEAFRSIAGLLGRGGLASRWFKDLEYTQWKGPTKDLSFIVEATPARVLLVDDLADRMHTG